METYVSTETITLTFPGNIEKTFVSNRVCIKSEDDVYDELLTEKYGTPESEE